MLDIGGVRVELFHSPSDLDDGISAWLPDEKVLMVGDAAYPMLPAIATPRFEFGRMSWEALETLDRKTWILIAGGHLTWVALDQGLLEAIPGRDTLADFAEYFDR